jgi:sterol desaturase/sphingolipid hydroxylase (fatty acid hydroxylase superfamily)
MRDNTRDYFYLTKISLFDSLSLLLLLRQSVAVDPLDEIIWFIPTSFLYEVIFDFFHYWIHRIIHSSPNLYLKIHAEHHAQIYIDPSKAFYQSLADLVFTNLLPLSIATYCVPVSPLFLFVFFWYKTFIEISGHIGKPIRATCFPQCMALPRLLGIALHAQDHEYHHIRPTTNFAKRFALWDILFQTYQPATRIEF